MNRKVPLIGDDLQIQFDAVLYFLRDFTHVVNRFDHWATLTTKKPLGKALINIGISLVTGEPAITTYWVPYGRSDNLAYVVELSEPDSLKQIREYVKLGMANVRERDYVSQVVNG